MNKKGFTLIELLAVILILGIIALIAIPTVTNIIEESKKGAAKTSVNGIVKAIENYISLSQLKSENVSSGQYILDGNSIILDGKEYKLDYKGMQGKGNIVIEDDELVAACININNYDVYYNGDNVSVESCESKKTLKETLETLPTKKVSINGKAVNKVYGDKDARKSMKNYVWYSGQLWQVLEVNDDGIKMVTSMSVTSIPYGETSDWNTSWVKKWLNKEFLNVLTKKDLIVDTTSCLDGVGVTFGDDATSNGIKIKTIASHTKIDLCSLPINEKVSLLTFEDYVYAYDGENPNYTAANFISGPGYEWIMTPYDDARMWMINDNDNYKYLTILASNSSSYGNVKVYGLAVRPVITIKGNVLVNDGTGANNDPYVLTSEEKLENGSKISNVKVGDYVYIDESNNPNSYTTDKVTRDVSYAGTKDKVRYRVVRKNSDGSIKIQRSNVLRNLPGTIALHGGNSMPYYYNTSENEDERCMEDSKGIYGEKNVWYKKGCPNNNIFNPLNGSGEYAYADGENIGYFLNNNINGYYSWLSNTAKKMLKEENWSLSTFTYRVDYETILYNTNVSSGYPNQSNDGTASAYIALPTSGDLYTGNDINVGYLFINRMKGSSTDTAYMSSSNGVPFGAVVAYNWRSVRPVMTLNSNVLIDSGRGTMTEPYSLKVN